MVGGGIGVVAHLSEYALEVAVHACGEIASGDGLQQCREFAQVTVTDLHHGIEVLHHQPEIVLELLGVATCTEVASGGGGGQSLDFGVDRQQAGLGCIHGLVQDGPAAGQATCVAAQVAVGIFVEHGDGIDDGIEMLEHHGVDALAQLAVDAGEIGGHAMAHILVGMQFDHARGFAGETLQLLLHDVHGDQQAAGFIACVGGDVVVQAAVGDGLGGAGGAVERFSEAAGDSPGQQTADDQYRHATGNEHVATIGHRLTRVGVGDFHLRFLQLCVFADLRLPCLSGWPRALAQ